MPRLGEKLSNKKRNILEALEEVEYQPGHLIEQEDNTPTYFYFILRGEVNLYKRPESMYTSTKERVKADDIDLFQNPRDSGNEKIGLAIGSMKGPCFVGDDAFCLS